MLDVKRVVFACMFCGIMPHYGIDFKIDALFNRLVLTRPRPPGLHLQFCF